LINLLALSSGENPESGPEWNRRPNILDAFFGEMLPFSVQRLGLAGGARRVSFDDLSIPQPSGAMLKQP
jgi:hypothetical protein